MRHGTLIKTDRLGRITISPEHREALLDKFEKSGVSGQEFSKLHGIKYTTFANWNQKRKRERDECGDLPCSSSVELIDSLREVEVSQPITTNTPSPVEIRLRDNAVVVLQNEGQIRLVCSLINALK